MSRRSTLAVFSTLMLLLGACGGQSEYPAEPITLISPYPSGNSNDLTSRALATALEEHLPQPVSVVNRPGGNGTIGLAEVFAAEPDGYTLGMGAIAPLTTMPHQQELPYGGPDDYTVISTIVTLPVVFFVRSDSAWQDPTDVVEAAQAAPGEVRIGSVGNSILELDLIQFERAAEIDLNLVPFEGPQQVAALLGGQVEAAVANPTAVVQHVEAGDLRVIGVFSDERIEQFPDAPTFAESGYDVTMSVFFALVGPKGMDDAIVETLDSAIEEAVQEESFVSFVEQNNLQLMYRGPSEAREFISEVYAQNGELLQELDQ